MKNESVHERYGKRTGERVGALTFIGLSTERADRARIIGVFSCECGNEIDLPAGRVLNGKSRSHCGCKTDRATNKTHGMRYSPEYSAWQGMKARCLDPDNKDYPRWGGKGVTIHQEWVDSFERFYEHIGSRPPGTSVDRKNTLLGYQPGNVRWATSSEQACNRSNSFIWTVKGVTFDSAEAAATHFGVSDVTIHRWVKGSHDQRRGTFTPAKEGCYAVNKY